MQKPTSSRQWERLEVPSTDFQHRVNQFSSEEGRSSTASVLSRLALIHQVAKAYAMEARHRAEGNSQDIAIEEITDPPLYDVDFAEGVVVIQYSYDESENTSKAS